MSSEKPAARQPKQSKRAEFIRADEDDEIYVEFAIDGEAGIYGVRGEVGSNISITREDGCTKRRVVQVAPTSHDIIEYLELSALVSNEHEGLAAQEIKLRRSTRRTLEKYQDVDIQVIEVTDSD